MKSKLTFLAALVAALVFVSSAAFASGTRMASMGLTGVEPMIQKDSAQWNWNPATIALFPTLITVYWDSASNTTGGGQMILKPIHGVELYSRVSADYCSDAFKAVDAAGDPAWNHMWNFGATNQAWDLTAWGPNATDVATNLGIPGALAGFTSTVQGGLPLFFAQNLPTADIAAGFPLGVPEFLAGVAPLLAAQNIASAVPPTLAVMMATMTLAYKINNMAYGVEASVGYTEENENSNLEYKVKVGAAVGITSSMSIDAAFCFGQAMTETSGRNQFDATLGKFTYESIPLVYDLYVYARFNWQFAETQNLHVYVKYSGADHSTNYSDDLGTDLDFERTQHKLQFGISDEMNFSKDSLVYLGINVLMDQRISEYSGKFGGKYSPLPASSRNASKLASDTTAWSMALHMGAEGKIIGGLIGRLGVVHDIMLYDVDNDSDDIAVGSSARYDTRTYNYRTTASIGLAYKIGQFMLEGTLNKALFTAGPNFISGNTNDLSGSITLIYFFGETAAAPAKTNEE